MYPDSVSAQVPDIADRVSKPETKTDSVDDNLKKLEDAINKLKPVQESDLDLTPASGRGDPINKDIKLSREQMIQLRKKLDEILEPQKKNNKQIESSTKYLDSPKSPLPFPFWYRGNPYMDPLEIPGPSSSFDYYSMPYYPYPLPPLYPYNENYKSFGTDFGGLDSSAGNPNYDIKNQFFPAPQPQSIDRPLEGYNQNQAGYNGYFPPQSGIYQSQSIYNDDSQIKTINELKNEIFQLETIIGSMNTPPYSEKYEDKTTLKKLNQEVQGLKVIISGLGQDISFVPPKPAYSAPPKPVYSAVPNPAYSSAPKPPLAMSTEPTDQNINPDYFRSNLRHKRSAPTEETREAIQVYDDVTSKLRDYLINDQKYTPTVDYNDIRSRIGQIKSQLGYSASNKEDIYYKQPLEYLPFEIYKEKPSISSQHKQTPLIDLRTPTTDLSSSLFQPKTDILTNIIVKIIEKVIAVVPQILGKLFGGGVQGIFDKMQHESDYYNKNNNYYNNYNGVASNDNNNSLESVFYRLGVFGYIPLFLLKLLKAGSAMVSSLKKNTFFKNFLFPAVIVLVVTGAIILLIWWFSGDDKSDVIKQITSENQQSFSDSNNNNYQNYRNAYTGTDYYVHNNNNKPYPYKFYTNPYYYYNNLRTVNGFSHLAPGSYFRTYFDDKYIKN